MQTITTDVWRTAKLSFLRPKNLKKLQKTGLIEKTKLDENSESPTD